MLHPANSYLDLAFLIPKHPPPGWQCPKFLIFFDDIAESIVVANFLPKRLPPKLCDKIVWFNADMLAEFREVESMKLKAGDVWGLCCTDLFGMGVDLPDIELIIQWKATCDLCTLWQRFGRCARKLSLMGRALFLVESKFFDAKRELRVVAVQAWK
ncbi:hypothetical protein PILCRDRAFT_82953 [Piloderma croceum F 1598]|uniref:Helicase C-terminal domain-containing protein n=1 Tax=Piloderma croceum (strain F 1598) TaxID=765440 RepID=A0A0C3ET69_PILCF|nr:hypothetical protein PILCRDRAFT_82953 [Piloderma croceum F 1598]